MSEMIDRVARAMLAELGHDARVSTFWLRAARRAIEAMREPTGEMETAGRAAAGYYVFEGHTYSEYTQDPSTFQPEGAAVCYRAMIDAALQEGEGR
jgi:hypothetical protein